MQSNYCNSCRNYLGDLTCLAYPDRIPNEILLGKKDHNEPLENQENDFIFEPKESKNEKPKL